MCNHELYWYLNCYTCHWDSLQPQPWHFTYSWFCISAGCSSQLSHSVGECVLLDSYYGTWSICALWGEEYTQRWRSFPGTSVCYVGFLDTWHILAKTAQSMYEKQFVFSLLPCSIMKQISYSPTMWYGWWKNPAPFRMPEKVLILGLPEKALILG